MLNNLKWDTVVTLESAQTGFSDFLHALFIKKSLEEKKTLYKKSIGGYGNIDEISKILSEENTGFIASKRVSEDQSTSLLFVFNESFLNLASYDNSINISIESFDEDWLDGVIKSICSIMTVTPPKGSVMMLASDGGSLYLTELGEIECPLERGNYTEKILEQYDNVVSDLSVKNPSGRLTVLDGAPGTGKSFLIRGLITEAEALYVYVPASIGGSLTGPDVIPVFLRERERDMPIVLIMEDADATISTRQIDNVGRLSDLLNMSDGLLGEMADIRILATTNAKKSEIDDAVLRVGRVNEHISFNYLTKSHAVDVFTRLTGIAHGEHDALRLIRGRSDKSNTLADIYKLARQYGWKPKVSQFKRKQRMNFLQRFITRDTIGQV